jgi:integrase
VSLATDASLGTQPAAPRRTPPGRARDVDASAALNAVLRPGFLTRAGWDSQRRILAPARDDPLLGLRKCAVVDCEAGIRRSWAQLCSGCDRRFKAAERPFAEFVARASGKANWNERICRVGGCPRPTRARDRLCRSHSAHRRTRLDLSVEAWLQLPSVGPLASFGDCLVASCIRTADGQRGLCGAHDKRWAEHRQSCPDADFDAWAEVNGPAGVDHIVVLKGLPVRVQRELLVTLQQRTDEGLRTFLTDVRYLAELLRARRAGTVFDLADVKSTDIRPAAGALLRMALRTVRCVLSTPEREQAGDEWDLAVFGLPGRLDFAKISQRWLREATKSWAAEDLPLHRGRQAASTARDTINAVIELSESLRLSRPDRGDDPMALGRRDILAFTNRLAYKQRTDHVTEASRVRITRRIRRFLDDVRTLGLTRPGQPCVGLPDDVRLRRGDVPAEADPAAHPRDLPATVLRTINEQLPVLQARSGLAERRIVELLIDTGRRPDEVCTLPWDCLDRDDNGKPVLVYTDSKNNRPGRRLPIAQDTAQLIGVQKNEARQRFPHTPLDQLVLFPCDNANPDGTKPMHAETFGNAHREFIDQIADLLLDEDNNPFDRRRVVPYAYRHSYAQRHADQGVAPDVLRELMGHRSMRTTFIYYRITETRTRAAVERVARHQFDGTGRRVFHSISGLLADEHARLRVGQVAVPFGMCTEPSNVKAGGQACPYKYTCVGCGHFRSDPSYLPELKSYLQQLLADRERLRAATDLEDWARQHLAPPDEQIDQLRALIRRIEDDLTSLNDDDRDQIQQAITVIRQTRQTVTLGMPGLRPPTADRR